MPFYDVWGTNQTYPLFAVGWAWAFDTPYKWTKQIPSFFGGTRQGTVISWPARIKDKGGVRWQFHHVIDIVPTILEGTGIQAPDMVDGIGQKPIEGVSMVYTFDKANADAPSTRQTQYFEMASVQGLYSDGWMLSGVPIRAPWELAVKSIENPATQYKYELYDLSSPNIRCCRSTGRQRHGSCIHAPVSPRAGPFSSIQASLSDARTARSQACSTPPIQSLPRSTCLRAAPRA